jgi:hypothetical protein
MLGADTHFGEPRGAHHIVLIKQALAPSPLAFILPDLQDQGVTGNPFKRQPVPVYVVY